MARGEYVLKDRRDKWWDVFTDPVDLTSYPEIEDWTTVLEIHRKERTMLQEILPKFDLYFDEYNAPGIPERPSQKKPKYFRKKRT